MKLFVDTSGWVALMGQRDKYHADATRAFASLKKTNAQLITTDYILDESLTNFIHSYGHHEAAKFGRWVLNAPIVEIMWIDEQLWDAAWAMFQIYDDKEWAFTDCTSFILMQRLGLYQAFSFDRHFAQAGFQLWPGVSDG